jgi:hypothetical protein
VHSNHIISPCSKADASGRAAISALASTSGGVARADLKAFESLVDKLPEVFKQVSGQDMEDVIAGKRS